MEAPPDHLCQAGAGDRRPGKARRPERQQRHPESILVRIRQGVLGERDDADTNAAEDEATASPSSSVGGDSPTKRGLVSRRGGRYLKKNYFLKLFY